jgi:hypothetical protein
MDDVELERFRLCPLVLALDTWDTDPEDRRSVWGGDIEHFSNACRAVCRRGLRGDFLVAPNDPVDSLDSTTVSLHSDPAPTSTWIVHTSGTSGAAITSRVLGPLVDDDEDAVLAAGAAETLASDTAHEASRDLREKMLKASNNKGMVPGRQFPPWWMVVNE